VDKLNLLQQKIKEDKKPVIILFEGWGASGKGRIISKLIESLDPRGFKVYTIGEISADEKRYPRMKRFWAKIPEYGKISIFDRSWYRDVSITKVEQKISRKELNDRFEEILEFERQLCNDGYIILKFFLRLSKEEQRNRFKKLDADKVTNWRVTKDDWKRNSNYDKYLKAFNTMIERTDTPHAPWRQIDADDKKLAAEQVISQVIDTLENHALIQVAQNPQKAILNPISKLSEVIQNTEYDELNYKRELKALQKRLYDIHNRLYQKKIPLIIVYEGWDAAGKGGNIKRLTEGLDPRGYEVIPIAAPTLPELHRQYLWRFWNAVPKDGHIAIYDRSWYGRVMVERIEGFCTEEQWNRAFDEMNRFEYSLRKWGAVIVKVWLHIDSDEQLRRFEDRQNTPEKQWKITDEDWRNRAKWDEYEIAVDDMLKLTNTDYAPWIVVESNNKKYARVKVITEIIKQIERYDI
jgi:polyphosphate:AMP phosphotransferase